MGRALPAHPDHVLRFMSAMNEAIERQQPQAEESTLLVPPEPLPPISSRFLFVDVAALRAKQLRRGARVRYEAELLAIAPKKAERVAMEEVRRGLVYYHVPPQRPVHLSREDTE